MARSDSDPPTDRTAAGPPTTDAEVGRSAGLETIRDVYADQADTMVRMDWLNRLVTGRYRERVFGNADGRVLDVACGIGTNARYLPPTAEYVGVDVSPEMVARARKRLSDRGRDGTVRVMDAEDLDFDDDSFDSVVSSLSTCTFPDPVAALNEMARACRSDGQVLLLEHGRSDVGPIARFQDWRADAHFEKHACRWNQEPLELVAASDLVVREARSSLLGIVTEIEARPE